MKPGQRHLYRVSSTLPHIGSPLRPAVCLTCTISSDMTNDDKNEHWSSSNWQSSLSNRNEWHDHYEIHTDGKEHRQTKDISKKDKLKNRNVLSECQHHFSSLLSQHHSFYFVSSCLKSLKEYRSFLVSRFWN